MDHQIDLCLYERQADNNKKISAICASPSVLGVNDILKGYKVICYPGYESNLNGAEIVNEKVVCDRNIITSKGPGTSFDFALAILNNLKGEECVKSVCKGLLYSE